MLGVVVRAANPMPDKAVTIFIKIIEGETIVRKTAATKVIKPPIKTALWPRR